MSQRMSQYKQGSYGSARKKTTTDEYKKHSAANQLTIAKNRNLAPLARRGFNTFMNVSNKERKYFDSPGQGYAVNTNGIFILAHIPILGSDYNNRIGRKTVVRSLYIRGHIGIKAAGSIESGPAVVKRVDMSITRMIIFVDAQPNGVAPVVTDLLNTASPSSHLNPNNRDRFRILKDKIWAFDPYVYQPVVANGAIAAFNRTNYPIKLYKKLNIETVFNADVNQTIAAINTNAIYVFFIGSQPAGDTDNETRIAMRVRFDDA